MDYALAIAIALYVLGAATMVEYAKDTRTAEMTVGGFVVVGIFWPVAAAVFLFILILDVFFE